MIYDQLYISMHIKSNATDVLSKTTRVTNTLGKCINLLKCLCHASLSFIDPFNNPIITLMTGVKLDGKSIWKIHMDFFFENPFFLNLF